MTQTSQLRIATRKSPLALLQTGLALEHLRAQLPGVEFSTVPMSTVGDERMQWSLSVKGGKGLFTSALEQAIAERQADLAVHSAKDLPTEMAEGLTLAGYLPRANPCDVLILRRDVQIPARLATGSPRRRQQLQRFFPNVEWTEIRGNVATRLDKIAEGYADGTIMAMAGLARLNLWQHSGLNFMPLSMLQCVPAAGQGAIAIQCRQEDAALLSPLLCQETNLAVTIERRALQALGGGCHNASAAHYANGNLFLFTESSGIQQIDCRSLPDTAESLTTAVKRLISTTI
jgi:hydroxymethylbilane synthase